jgi:glucose dehydrogenase
MSHQIALTLTVLLSTFTIAEAQGTIESNPGEWRYYGGDQGGLKYSPIDQINRENVDQLTIAWEWKTG